MGSLSRAGCNRCPRLSRRYRKLYRDRKLTQGYPQLDSLATAYFAGCLGMDAGKFSRQMPLIGRLIDLEALGSQTLVVGCGPKPDMVKSLLANGYDVRAVDVIPEYARLGGEYIGDPDRVRIGSAEALPFADASQTVVLLDAVLEHVDSCEQTLKEIYRVLKPGGVCFISTTNRWRFSVVGYNGEYRVRFLNWFPRLLKEAYVFHHLHYRPTLANFSPRPAVHWFSYSELCRLGRQAGFAQFYSPLDLMEEDDPRFSAGFVRKALRPLLSLVKYNPVLRAIALSQNGSIYMWKRAEP